MKNRQKDQALQTNPSRREGYGTLDATVVGHSHQAQRQARDTERRPQDLPRLAFRHAEEPRRRNETI